MKNFRHQADTREFEPITRGDYERLRESSLGFMALAGTEFIESDYELDFATEFLSDASYGPYLQIGHRVRVSFDRKPRSAFESLFIRIDDIGQSPERIDLLCSARANVTTMDGNVSYPRFKRHLPKAHGRVSEAQPDVDLDLLIRREFEAWEHELRAPGILTVYDARQLLSEMEALKQLG